MTIPKEASCRKATLHDFKDVSDHRDAQVEMCRFCSAKNIYHKDDRGRIDNRRYLRSHFRSFVQPLGPTSRYFREVWGDKAYWDAVKYKKWKKPTDWEEAMTDARKYLREMQSEKTLH